MKKIMILCFLVLLALSSCYRLPDLHLYDWENPAIELPVVELHLDTYWNYENGLGTPYKWRNEWYYGACGQEGGWDTEDLLLFGELEPEMPNHFFIRRYFKGSEASAPRIRKSEAEITGRIFRAQYDWGWWDILAWNDVKTLDGVQSLHFDEKNALDAPIMAYTNESQHSVRYHAPRFQHAFYEPELLFSGCEEDIDINQDLSGFVYIEDEHIWLRTLHVYLEPITYIYLPQIILHHNINPATGRRRILTKDENGGSQTFGANISGMARTTCLNTGVAGTDAVAVNYNMRAKEDMDMNGETVDIIGGRFITFGICGQNGNRITSADQVKDTERHYIDVNFRFSNGMDSTIVFDVTKQVQQRWKGGVITLELDMDDVPMPYRPGGSGFDAVVKDYDYESYEIDM